MLSSMRVVPRLVTMIVCWAGLSIITSAAAEPPIAQTPTGEGAPGVEQLYDRVKPSLAVITVVGRDGRQRGLGTGFVVAADGLIATNLHVIGEGRPFAVQMADGKRYEVTGVHASDRNLDLAVIRVDAKALVPLELGDSDALHEGQPVVALGNPQGLNHSVVAGVVSGRREIDGREMIQLAIPLEPGNSGGPLVDAQGQVCGVLTMKSLVTANLGFAAAVNHLKPLLARPNPVPIARWIKQGSLDPREWTPLMGGNWRKRAGRIVVDGEGDGFGGRSLCLAVQDPPAVPYELTVTVRLDDESGAAGLVFAGDGGERHYGFYPSGGAVRLTRFAGPSVMDWTILAQRPTSAYRPGEWNTLKVRVEAEQMICSVNGQVVVTESAKGLASGKLGLAKFRDTRAEFKNFQFGRDIAAGQLSADAQARIDRLAGETPSGPVPPEVIERLTAEPAAGVAAIAERAASLSRQAERLRLVAEAVRQAQVREKLVKALEGPEEKIDLLTAALLVAKLDNEDVDVADYCRQVDRMAADIAGSLPADADDRTRLAALDRFFFAESGFHGSRSEYYHRANSHLNAVLDDREGLPITLSVVYMELARRLKLTIEGVGFPGHFVVRYRPAEGDSRLIDVFDSGNTVSPEEAARRVAATTGAPLTEEQSRAVTKRAIVARMLHNLIGTARLAGDASAMLRYLDALLDVSPEAAGERWMRAMLRWQAGDRKGAAQDADWLLSHEPTGVDLEQVRDFRAVLERAGP